MPSPNRGELILEQLAGLRLYPAGKAPAGSDSLPRLISVNLGATCKVREVVVLTDWWQKRPRRIIVFGETGACLGQADFDTYTSAVCGAEGNETCEYPARPIAHLRVPCNGGQATAISVFVNGMLDPTGPYVNVEGVRVFGRKLGAATTTPAPTTTTPAPTTTTPAPTTTTPAPTTTTPAPTTTTPAPTPTPAPMMTAATLPARIALKSPTNGMFVCTESYGSAPMIANRYSPYVGASSWEAFNVVLVGANRVALQAYNGRYVSVDKAALTLLPSATMISNASDSTEIFEIVPLGGNNIALKSAFNGKYLCADGQGAKPLVANQAAAGSAETFEVVAQEPTSPPFEVLPPRIALRSLTNGKYVCTENYGSAPMIANRDSPYVGASSWEAFDVVVVGADRIALKAYNGKYVAVDRTALTLLPSAVTVSSAPDAPEVFEVASLATNLIVLKSVANDRFVSAPNAGAGALVASQATASTAETFEVVAQTPITAAI